MKKILLLLICFAAFEKAQSQTNPEIGKHFKFIKPTKVKECDDRAGNPKGNDIWIPVEYEFIVENITQNGVVISFLKWKNDPSAKANTKEKINSDANNEKNDTYRGSRNNDAKKLFVVPTVDFPATTTKLADRLSAVYGVSSTLIKLRPGSSDRNIEIGNNFNVGPSGGFRFRGRKNFNHFFLASVLFGSVKFTTANTRNNISEETNEFSVTPSIGYVLDFGKAQVGFFTGIDIASGSAYKSWIYKNRPWIGFNIGVSIFKDTDNTGVLQP